MKHIVFVFYRLSVDSSNISNDLLPISRVKDKYWRIEVTSGKVGSSGALPGLRIRWIPHRLLFLARREAPFTMGFMAYRLYRQMNSEHTR